MADSFNSFKLHSVTPNSTLNSSVAPKITAISSLSQSYCFCTHCTNLFTSHHHLEKGTSTGLHGQSQQSSRWSPTPAQLLVLEELYRQGTKTPTAEQIQQIASQLRRFGKIEGKNVFYWFQNHKARERQKRRRREMEETTASDSAEDKERSVMGSSEKHEVAGLRGTGAEVKETKKWASTSNCSGLAEEPASLDIGESGPNGWTKLEDREVSGRKATCQNVEMPFSLSNHLRKTTTTTSTSVAEEHRTPPLPQNLISQSYRLPFLLNRESFTYYDEEYAKTKTLELFPLKRNDQDDGISLNERKSRFCASTNSLGNKITSSQFFEFLPLKD